MISSDSNGKTHNVSTRGISPCPLCGGKGAVSMLLSGGCCKWEYFVSCQSLNCNYYGPIRKTPDEAISAWEEGMLL